MTYLYILQVLLTGTARLALKAALAFIIFLIVPVPTLASVSDWQQGASILPTSQPALSSDGLQESLRDLRDTGANYVTFVIQQYQTTMNSTDIRSGWNTPSDEDLAAAIDYAHSLGLNVMLKPHLDVTDPGYYRWRAHINPDDRDEWYRNYENMLLHYARLGEEHDVEMMSMGAELIDVATETSNPDNTRRWEEMIQSVRSVFSGDLTYSANWGENFYSSEKDHIEFWDDLDYMGISAYFELRQGSSVEDMRRAWDEWRRNDIEPLYEEYGKPILFTEIGYRSVEGAHEQPWSYEMTGAYNPGIQDRAYEALFSYWDDYSYMQGVHLWRWEENPNAGGQGDTDYTPQNKPALETMTAWFTAGGSGNDGGGGTDPGGDEIDADFSASANLGGSAVVGETVEFDVLVESSELVANKIIDIEIYDSGGQIFQTYFDNQSFAAGEENMYTVTWTPPQAGEFTIHVGVFENGWSELLFWENNALTFTADNDPGGGGEDTGGDDSSFSANASLGGGAVVGEQVDLSVSVESSVATSNKIIDVEVYNDSDSQVFQTFFDNQSFSNSEENTYDVTWTPQNAGTYAVHVGVFENGWSELLFWESNALTFSVETSSGSGNDSGNDGTDDPDTDPPSEGDIDIWWPIDGASISGLHPFKAMIPGLDVTAYDMYWQVGGGSRNGMYDSYEDYQHKEAMVDVTGWSWNENDTYTITFVAEEGGEMFAQESVDIVVR